MFICRNVLQSISIKSLWRNPFNHQILTCFNTLACLVIYKGFLCTNIRILFSQHYTTSQWARAPIQVLGHAISIRNKCNKLHLNLLKFGFKKFLPVLLLWQQINTNYDKKLLSESQNKKKSNIAWQSPIEINFPRNWKYLLPTLRDLPSAAGWARTKTRSISTITGSLPRLFHGTYCLQLLTVSQENSV